MKQQKAIAITILLVFLLNIPIISLLNKPLFVFGIPLVYVYVFSIWAFAIIVIAWIAESKNIEDTSEHE
ncbi:hypothetical protein Emtol_3803 [Emticicia oligotrophica DSM 17448]|uniref:DUF3311 domain-containing protein n=1 Tax=Emticicia oligotrophica (strain DSM 17448 / CIP 109782 / MTCC 6937 / GPTSA100-15) TaxID=929562 RepID=A0ABM5N640_EMTOG|nr:MULTISPECIES: hypothetical protein [Emticicia]AFK04929.1 hypothetical protein Emtol_3803 [Emticicia oligotrophica DSM 17448]